MSAQDRSAATKCCYRSSIVLDFDQRVTFRRCPVHGETEHIYQPPRPLSSRGWRARPGQPTPQPFYAISEWVRGLADWIESLGRTR